MDVLAESYVIVDIETTGLEPSAHGITEIAIWRFAGGKVLDRFRCFINPNQQIPAPITRLTGIRQSAVDKVPPFPELATEIFERLGNAIFVAHNAAFDLGFLKHQFALCGLDFYPPKLCTMRLARQLIPSARSVSLSALSADLKLCDQPLHRAETDVDATLRLFEYLIQLPGAHEAIKKQLTKKRRITIPAALANFQLSELPTSAGVYTFFDSNQKPIYIGKAKNIRQRVASHFSGSDNERKKHNLLKKSERFSFTPTLNENEALLLEDASIRHSWPELNAAQKSRVVCWRFLPYRNRLGEHRLAITNRHSNSVFGQFHSAVAARQWLYERMKEQEIDPIMMGVAAPEWSEKATKSNESGRIEAFIAQLRMALSESAVVAVPVDNNRKQAVQIEAGRYLGYGCLRDAATEGSPSEWTYFHSAPDTPAAWMVIRRMLAQTNVEIYAPNEVAALSHRHQLFVG